VNPPAGQHICVIDIKPAEHPYWRMAGHIDRDRMNSVRVG
jgi:hypothetical protein